MLLPHIGRFEAGPLDAITDVGQISVGHETLAKDDIQTGVTVVLPHQGNLFRQKVPAAVAVINGFGKSVGLIQLQELGLIETPIALTNTFSVPAISAAQIKQCITINPQCGRTLPTVNSLVLECNDGYLNDIQQMQVADIHYKKALANASKLFDQGAVGAGRGMSCFQLKGGIGTASRILDATDGMSPSATIGALVLANFGQQKNLLIAGEPIGQALQKLSLSAAPDKALSATSTPSGEDKGSIIMVLATDAYLDSRQLHRLAVRAGAGLARTGSYYGHGSGDIALAFSTAYTVPHQNELKNNHSQEQLLDEQLDPFFEAAADCIEQAILSALWHAQTVKGFDEHVRFSLATMLSHLS